MDLENSYKKQRYGGIANAIPPFAYYSEIIEGNIKMKPKIFDTAIESYRNIEAAGYLGIFGHPIKHTLSPIIHDTLSAELGIDERYIAFDVDSNLKDRVRQAYKEGIIGLNITVPYKQEVMEALVEIDSAAVAIGAVNTLVRVEGGYKGYNTDMPGLAKAIESEGISLKGKNVVMLGAGGAARAVAYMCMTCGAARVYIINRTYENAYKLAEDMNNINNPDLEEKSTLFIPLASTDYKQVPEGKYIFLQCTSVGLKEKDGLPLVEDRDFYAMAEAGIDLIYNPARTSFLNIIEENGSKAVNGLKMLLYQGIMAYELWNKVSVSDELSDLIYRKLCQKLYG